MITYIKKWFRPLLITSAILAAVGIVGGSIFFFAITYDLPQPEEITDRKINESTKIYDRTGTVLLYEIHGDEKRTFITEDQIPNYVKHAVISIEDDSFYTHPAIDIKGIMRAVIVDIISGSPSQGGSTITQQLAKLSFLTTEKTITRKLKELVLALRLEKRYEKDEILTFYINQIPYGSNLYGIESAAQTFFNKPTNELTLNEAAMLAALPQAPSYYSPWGNHVDELMQRKDYVLKRMYELGYIDLEQFETNYGITPEIAAQTKGSIKAPHFVMYVQDHLRTKYGESILQTGGLKIVTTLDWDLQQIAEEVVADGVARNTELYEGRNGALVAMDPKTGQVLSMVGSADYFDIENDGNFNVATQGLRQPGSTFKPFAYVTAFKKGLTPDTIVWDVQTEFDTTGLPQYSYQPHNFDNTFRGPVTLKSALAESMNIPAVKTLYLAGIDDTIKTAESFGISTLTDRSRFGLSLVLGGGEVTLFELVGAYSVFADDGIKHRPSAILSVETTNGEMLETYIDSQDRVIDAQHVRLINNILSSGELRRPLYGSSFSLTQVPGHQVALKTGTTNDYVDAWTIGYTPNLVVGVWAGNNHREPLQRRGGSVLAAVPMWHDFTSQALQGKELETFNRPAPLFVNNPILRGEFPEGENVLHSTLYYLGKLNDPQFTNWENGVSQWLTSHTVDVSQFIFTEFTDDTTQTQLTTSLSGVRMTVLTPQNGVFIKENELIPVTATIYSSSQIKNIEILFNDALIEERGVVENEGVQHILTTSFIPDSLDLQNKLTIRVTNSEGSQEKDVIVYRR
jgi:1A family penicillin-binding protein